MKSGAESVVVAVAGVAVGVDVAAAKNGFGLLVSTKGVVVGAEGANLIGSLDASKRPGWTPPAPCPGEAWAGACGFGRNGLNVGAAGAESTGIWNGFAVGTPELGAGV